MSGCNGGVSLFLSRLHTIVEEKRRRCDVGSHLFSARKLKKIVSSALFGYRVYGGRLHFGENGESVVLLSGNFFGFSSIPSESGSVECHLFWFENFVHDWFDFGKFAWML